MASDSIQERDEANRRTGDEGVVFIGLAEKRPRRRRQGARDYRRGRVTAPGRAESFGFGRINPSAASGRAGVEPERAWSGPCTDRKRAERSAGQAGTRCGARAWSRGAACSCAGAAAGFGSEEAFSWMFLSFSFWLRFRFGCGGKWSARQDLHLRSPGSRPGMLLLHHALIAPAIRKAPGAWFCWRQAAPSLDGGPR